MKKLTKYAKGRIVFTLYARHGDLAVFRCRRLRGAPESWEVVRIDPLTETEIESWRFANEDYAAARFQIEIFKTLPA